MKVVIAGALALTLVAGAAFAQSTGSGQTPPTSKTAVSPEMFVAEAAVGNQFEIDESKLAVKRATSPKIKQFARRMITDHTKAGKELKKTVAKAGTGTIPVALDASHQSSLDALGKESGVDFDRTYVMDQQKAHDDAVAAFSQYAENGTQPDLKAFAAKTLPTLQDHQKHVRMLPTDK